MPLVNWMRTGKFIIVLVLVLFLKGNLYSQQGTSVDGLLKLIERPDDSSKVVALKLLCWEYRNTDTASALKYGYQAIEIAKKLELDYELADIYNRVGVVRRNQGNYAHALDNYFKGIEISKRNNYQKLLAFAYNNVADIYNRLEIYDKALEFGKYSLKLSLNLNDEYTLSYVYNILGGIYRNKKDLDSSLLYFNHSLNLRKKINYTAGVATSLLNIGNIQFLRGEYDSCYSNILKAIEIYNDKNDQTGLVGAYKHLGLYFNKVKDYKKAINYFNKCLALNESFADLQIKKDANDGLSYSYAQLGDIKKAYHFKNLACAVGDSITTNLFVEKITHLTENYKFELKRQEDDLLRKEKVQSLNNQIKYQRSIIKLYAFILFLLVVLGFVFIYYYRQKNRIIKVLTVQKREIDELNSTKDKLFSILAHDLKNPISSVIGLAELLKDESIILSESKRAQLISNLYEVGLSSNRILDEVLSWSQIQANQVVVESREINLRELVERVVTNQQPIAGVKNISISYSVNTEVFVQSDYNIVSTVLRNLIANAIKYSYSNAEILVSVGLIVDFVEVSIKDNGVGMSDDIKESLLHSVNIQSTRGTSNERGSGLGLVICRELITKIGGKLLVESEVGKGSTFSFTIPIRD